MSAYVVDPNTINKIVSGIDSGQYCAYRLHRLAEEGFDIRCKEQDRERLGQAMHDLNLEAVRQRYPNEPDEDLPGIVGPKVYEYRYVLPGTQIATIKAAHCWRYQCSEGDVPERPLFKLMDEIVGGIEHDIIAAMPEYEQAEWG